MVHGDSALSRMSVGHKLSLNFARVASLERHARLYERAADFDQGAGKVVCAEALLPRRNGACIFYYHWKPRRLIKLRALITRMSDRASVIAVARTRRPPRQRALSDPLLKSSNVRGLHVFLSFHRLPVQTRFIQSKQRID